MHAIYGGHQNEHKSQCRDLRWMFVKDHINHIKDAFMKSHIYIL